MCVMCHCINAYFRSYLVEVSSDIEIKDLFSLFFQAPMRAFYLFWIHIAAPWIFAPAPEEGPMDEKKQRRMERRQTKFKRA